VLVCGCDPTGLLWRPFAGSRHAEWRVSGLADLATHQDLLTRLVDEMDARIADLPADRDTIETTPERPLLVVVLEEYAACSARSTRPRPRTTTPAPGSAPWSAACWPRVRRSASA